MSTPFGRLSRADLSFSFEGSGGGGGGGVSSVSDHLNIVWYL